MLKLLSKTEFDNYICKIKPNNKYGVFRSLADVKQKKSRRKLRKKLK